MTRIFYEVDIQNDFMNQNGALYVPDAESIKGNIKKLVDYAIKCHIPRFGSVDKHFGINAYKSREGELSRWGGPFPDHCMVNTIGQERIIETKFANELPLFIAHDPDNKYDFYALGRAIDEIKSSRSRDYKPRGVYFEKQSYDVFTNPTLVKLLEKKPFDEAVIYGVATDFCVKAAVLGLQKSGVKCYVVGDAIKGVFPDKTLEAIAEMKNAGAEFVLSKDITGNKI